MTPSNLTVNVAPADAHADAGDDLSSLDHMPGARWAFDASVTTVFDDMLARSIPHIESMRSVVTAVASRFVQPGTHVVDLGCSLGGAIAPLVDRFATQNTFIGIEASQPMADACLRRFQPYVERGVVEIRSVDLRYDYPDVRASVTLAVLTLMFTPLEHRPRVFAAICAHTAPAGALVLVEKVISASDATTMLFDELYRQHKLAMGYSEEAIARKALSLEGVLVPVTASWNEQMLAAAGFSRVECIWRCLNFCGWVAIK